MHNIIDIRTAKYLEMKDIFLSSWEEDRNLWVDFSEEKIEKALFLDIDGVIQPFTEYRFKYVNKEDKMEQLYKELENEFKIDYREFHKYDVAAAYYDWDKNAVNEIKRILDTTGAKIVMSSDWRYGMLGSYLPFLLRIHDLQKYLYGYTPNVNSLRSFIKK